jgi:hypothetical protein
LDLGERLFLLLRSVCFLRRPPTAIASGSASGSAVVTAAPFAGAAFGVAAAPFTGKGLFILASTSATVVSPR